MSRIRRRLGSACCPAHSICCWSWTESQPVGQLPDPGDRAGPQCENLSGIDRQAFQIQWLEKSLSASKAKWKLVVGHHPLYAFTQKSDTERQDMRDAIESILEKYNVDMYLCGHIHNFQHIKPAGSKVEYLVNSSGSLARKVESIDGTQYCSDKEGFTMFSVNDNELSFYLMDSEGNSIYQYAIKK